MCLCLLCEDIMQLTHSLNIFLTALLLMCQIYLKPQSFIGFIGSLMVTFVKSLIISQSLQTW